MDESILEDKQHRWVPWAAAATALVAAYAIAVAWTGGFTLHLGFIRLRSHSWIRPAILAFTGAAALTYFARRGVTALVTRTAQALESHWAFLTLAIAATTWAFVAGAAFGTFAVGGADSYGYVGQARLFAEGRLTDTVPVSDAYTWPDVAATFTPLGFTPGLGRGVIAPKYPPGLALLMTPFVVVAGRAVYFVVPCFGALLVWTTFRLGSRMGDSVAGAFAAVLLSVSPTFLYQAVQPMSDVPAAACWLVALLVATRGTTPAAASAGVMASIAVLIRPNLAPLAAIVLATATFAREAGDGPARVRRAIAFTAAMLPALAALGWIQAARYGSAFASGYGSLSDAFSIAYIAENLARYPRWLTETHTWFIWLSLAAPLWIVRRSVRPRLGWTALALAAAVWAAYLPYLFFHPEEWFYTRFLLPAIAVMLLFSAAIARWMIGALPLVARAATVVGLMTALAVHSLHVAQSHGAFDIRAQERKYPLAGAFVRDRLPERAIVLAAQHSGSIRYYADRPTFRWDLLAPWRLDQALATFRAQGYEPFLVVDGGEYDEFKKRFDAAGQRASQHPALLAITGDARVYALP